MTEATYTGTAVAQVGFCTVQDMEEFLQQDIEGAAAVTQAQKAIDDATAVIRNYCGQEISLVEDEEITLDSSGRFKLFLPELPVTEVSAVIEDGETLTEDEDYKLGQWGILHRVSSSGEAIRWASGIQVITVTYSHGYETVPADVAAVCTRAASRQYQAGLKAAENEGLPGLVSKSLGDYAVTFGSEQGGGAGGESVLGASASPMLLRSEMVILDRYRYRPC